MDSTSTYALRRADDLIRSGKPEYAQTILIEYLRRNPKSEQGWLLLSLVLPERQKQMESLRLVLRINPNNVIARSRLAQLQLEAASPPISASPNMEKAADKEKISIQLPDPGEITNLESKGTPAAFNLFAEAQPKTTRGKSPLSILKQLIPLKQSATGRSRAKRSSSLLEAIIDRIYRQSKRNPEILTIIIGTGLVSLIVLVSLITMAGLRNYREVSAYNTQTVFQATYQAQLVALPIWTPTPANDSNSMPTITPTALPTPTATLPAPAPTTVAQMRHIQQQVAELRSLEIIDEVDPYLVNQKTAQDILSNDLVNQGSTEKLRDEAKVLTVLGLIEPSYDLNTYALNGMIDRIGGVYLPWRKQILILEQEFSGTGQYIYAHEYDHALIDQHFNIADKGIYPFCLNNTQSCEAIRALIEGDATLLMSQWLQQYASPEDNQDMQNTQSSIFVIPDQYPSPFVSKNLSFPYIAGAKFVLYLYNRGNWSLVDKAYTELPESTEQILHPEKYLKHEAPLILTDPPLREVLADDWHEIHSDVMGEWLTYMILGYGADLSAQQEDAVAADAAAGWGGDFYQAYYAENTNQIVLAAHWQWDSQTDAQEFNSSMLDYLHKRFQGNKINRDQGNCWQSVEQTSCLFEKGSHTLWIIAPNEDIINQIVPLYTNFNAP